MTASFSWLWGGYTLRSKRNSGQMANWGAYCHTKDLGLTQDPRLPSAALTLPHTLSFSRLWASLSPVSHSYITLPLQPGALLVLSFFLVLCFLLSYLSLVYWPCSVYNFLSMFWTLPDASVCPLPHIYSNNLPQPHFGMATSSLYTSGAETQEGQAWAPFRVAQPLLTIVSTCLFNKCLLIPSDSWRLPCPPRCPRCWPLSTRQLTLSNLLQWFSTFLMLPLLNTQFML